MGRMWGAIVLCDIVICFHHLDIIHAKVTLIDFGTATAFAVTRIISEATIHHLRFTISA